MAAEVGLDEVRELIADHKEVWDSKPDVVDALDQLSEILTDMFLSGEGDEPAEGPVAPPLSEIGLA